MKKLIFFAHGRDFKNRSGLKADLREGIKKRRNFISVTVLALIIAMLVGVLSAFSGAAADNGIEVEGAQIRVEGVQGLRFVAKIKKSSFELVTGENANFGILLIPQSSVGADAVIDKSTEKVLTVPAKKLLTQDALESMNLTYDASCVYFSAVLIGIPEEFYGVDIIARAYVESGENYTYSRSITRSVKFIAEEIKNDENASVEEKACAARVLAAYEMVGNDMLINAELNGQLFYGGSNKDFDSSALQNTYNRLTVDKRLNVAYLGGSVTSGVGLSAADQDTKSWRGLTTAWLKNTFPFAVITETTASIGGTGSVFGAYRAIDDLKLTDDEKKPDLLFVEFAINDKYDSHQDPADYVPEVKSYMEAIVRTVREYSPYCDIVFCFTTDKEMLATEYPTLKAHKAVAEAYGIPTISLGARLVTEEGLTKNNWDSSGFFDSWKQADGSTYYDIVHPSEKGYAKYASYVIEYLRGELVDKSLDAYSRIQNELPDVSFDAVSNPARYFFNDASGKAYGFELVEDTGLATKGYLKTSTNGAKVTFTFTGTGLQLWTYAKSQASTVKVTVDGVSQTYSIQRGSANHKAYRVAEGLDYGVHTVTIEVISVPVGYDFELRALMVEGDSKLEGVTFLAVD